MDNDTIHYFLFMKNLNIIADDVIGKLWICIDSLKIKI